MKYKKKPVVIEAFQYDGDFQYINGDYYVPQWAIDAYEKAILYFKDAEDLYIKTLEGDMKANVGDYIIKGVQGEIYACKPNIFEQTYDEPDSKVTVDVNIMDTEIMKEFIALTKTLMNQIEESCFEDEDGNFLHYETAYIALNEFVEEHLSE